MHSTRVRVRPSNRLSKWRRWAELLWIRTADQLQVSRYKMLLLISTRTDFDIENCFSDDYSLVIERSNGLWHTKCFNRSTSLEPDELLHICAKLGYKNVTAKSADARIHDPTARNAAQYRQAPTKAQIVNPYSPLRVNDAFVINAFKPSRPFNRITKWDAIDEDNCVQYEINCETQNKR